MRRPRRRAPRHVRRRGRARRVPRAEHRGECRCRRNAPRGAGPRHPAGVGRRRDRRRDSGDSGRNRERGGAGDPAEPARRADALVRRAGDAHRHEHLRGRPVRHGPQQHRLRNPPRRPVRAGARRRIGLPRGAAREAARRAQRAPGGGRPRRRRLPRHCRRDTEHGGGVRGARVADALREAAPHVGGFAHVAPVGRRPAGARRPRAAGGFARHRAARRSARGRRGGAVPGRGAVHPCGARGQPGRVGPPRIRVSWRRPVEAVAHAAGGADGPAVVAAHADLGRRIPAGRPDDEGRRRPACRAEGARRRQCGKEPRRGAGGAGRGAQGRGARVGGGRAPRASVGPGRAGTGGARYPAAPADGEHAGPRGGCGRGRGDRQVAAAQAEPAGGGETGGRGGAAGRPRRRHRGVPAGHGQRPARPAAATRPCRGDARGGAAG